MPVRAVLFLTVALPALAVSLGRADGRVVFVLYREPKLVAALFLSWILLATVAWTRPEVFRLGRLAATARRPAVWLGLATGGWLAVTGLWVQVRPNWTYEMVQYVTFGALFVVIVSWSGLERSRSESGVLRTGAGGGGSALRAHGPGLANEVETAARDLDGSAGAGDPLRRVAGQPHRRAGARRGAGDAG